jgi:DNA-3-methyladenine glycosylase II
MPPYSREQIKQYLVKRDRRLRPLIAQLEFPVARRNRDVYATLLRSIISQQLSIKAAHSIHARVYALFADGYPAPEVLYRMHTRRLRAAGLSRQKIDYLKAVACFALEQGMDYATLAKYSDTEIIEHLTQIRGVGRWTVEMLLMFSFQRRDVFAVDDVGIQNAMRGLYGLEHNGKILKRNMLTIAEAWRPYRSIVCKYLWQWKNLPDTRS